MHESADFIRSLEHTNPDRPRFKIAPALVTQLEIEFAGQSMAVPLGELLEFARRWFKDHEQQAVAGPPTARLRLFPYPIYNAQLGNPDFPGWG